MLSGFTFVKIEKLAYVHNCCVLKIRDHVFSSFVRKLTIFYKLDAFIRFVLAFISLVELSFYGHM